MPGWQNASPEQRRRFVDAMFEILNATHAETIAEMSNEKFRSALSMIQATRDMDPETRRCSIT